MSVLTGKYQTGKVFIIKKAERVTEKGKGEGEGTEKKINSINIEKDVNLGEIRLFK